VRIDEVIVPATLSEALSALKRNPDAVLCAGGTELFSEGPAGPADRNRTLISLHGIQELRHVSRTDLYVEVGSMTTLAELLALKEGFVPETLRSVVHGIGTFAVRNLATLGGNLSVTDRFRDCFPILACMDALAEYRQGTASRWVNLNRLIGPRGTPEMPRGEILTRIRIPLGGWDLGIAHKLGFPRINSRKSSLFVALARTDKRALSDIRILYACDRALRSREIESSLAGKKIPLLPRDIESAVGAYADYCSHAGIRESSAARFLTLVRRAFNQLNEGVTA